MRRVLYAVICITVLSGCAHSGPAVAAPGVWDDSALVAGQRIELERLADEHERMGQFVREFSERNDRIASELTESLARGGNIQAIGAAMDRFVRELIEENRTLKEWVRANWPEDAGEGRGDILAVPGD